LIDGRPCYGSASYFWGTEFGCPLETARLRQSCYVCPKTGLLKRVPRHRRTTAVRRPDPPAFIPVSDRLQCRFVDGRWELVTLAALPSELARSRSTERDAVLDRPVAGMDVALARRIYGAAVYATGRRVLNRREQKQFPIPIEHIR
jgi:hypothetical protein